MNKIEGMAVGSGRILKEDGGVINEASFIELSAGGAEQFIIKAGETWTDTEECTMMQVIEEAVIGSITSTVMDKDGTALTTLDGITLMAGLPFPIHATSVAVTSGTILLFR